MAFFWDARVMFIAVNSGKVGRLIAIAEAAEGWEGEVVDEESAGIENKVDRR